MEDTLRETLPSIKANFDSLNPCFNGRYSQSKAGAKSVKNLKVVLILVLMEDTLREQRLVSLCLSSFDVCLPL